MNYEPILGTVADPDLILSDSERSSQFSCIVYGMLVQSYIIISDMERILFGDQVGIHIHIKLFSRKCK